MSKNVILNSETARVTLQFNGGPFTEKLAKSLPFESRSSTWGEEIYFAVPIEDYSGDETTLDVEAGDVAYWPEGNSLAIFFGSTPLSDGDKPVPADEVEVVGAVTDGFERLEEIEAGETLSLELVSA